MLQQVNCIKRKASGTAFTLQADTGESFLIKSIIFGGATATDGYPVLRVDRKTVGCYRGGAAGLNHLGHQVDTYIPMNLMDWLMSKGVNMAIPVAEGQTFTIDRGESHTGDVVVIYDMYDAGDIRADMVNGSEAKEYHFIQYMTASEALAADGDHLLDVSLSPGEFPDFPCGKVVPARHSIDILGIAGAPFSEAGAATGEITSEYIKLIKDRETLFDEDRNGIPFFGKDSTETDVEYLTEMSLIGDCVSIATGLSNPSYGVPLLFDPPLHFVSGEELLTYLSVDWATDASLVAAHVRVALIEHVIVE